MEKVTCNEALEIYYDLCDLEYYSDPSLYVVDPFDIDDDDDDPFWNECNEDM